MTAERIWRVYQRWRRYLAQPEPPCSVCRHLVYDDQSLMGVRCVKGTTRDQGIDISCQYGDFSCFEQLK